MALQLDIVTPESLLLSTTAEMVVVPGEAGDFGVLPGHIPLISTLRPGFIDVYRDGATINERFFVRGGFAEATATRCIILAESAIDLKNADKQDLQQQVEALRAKAAKAEQKQKPEAEIAALNREADALELLLAEIKR